MIYDEKNDYSEKESSRRSAGKSAASHGTGAEPAFFRTGTVPEISLPRGGGAVRSIDEKFSVNAVNGTNSLSLALPIAPARSGFSPAISLGYSSGAGNGSFGLGWTVSIPGIKRKTDKELPRYRDAMESDTFVLSDAEDLIPVLDDDLRPVVRESGDFSVKSYRPRIEGGWAKIEQWKNTHSGEIMWRAISTANVTTWYGADRLSRIADPADETGRIYQWLLSHSFDDKGNLIVYEYKEEDFQGVLPDVFEKNRSSLNCTNRYIKRVLYGNKTPYRRNEPLPPPDGFMFETVFDYGEHDADTPAPDDNGTWAARPDPFSFFKAGFDIRTYRLCMRVLLFHRFEELAASPCLVSALALGYDCFPDKEAPEDLMEGFTYLKRATQYGYIYDPGTGTYTSKSLPPMHYYYQPHAWNTEVRTASAEDMAGAPSGIDFENSRWIDLFSEGISGILTEEKGALYYKENLGGGRFGPPSLIVPKPSMTAAEKGTWDIRDISGAGDAYLVNHSGRVKGFSRLDDDDGWQHFIPFEQMPSRDFANDPRAVFIDLNGDGLPDVLITEQEFFEWHESLGEKGWGPANRISCALDEEQGPRVVFQDAIQRVFIADMTGDGLSDLVRIRNGEVCYWANLGYGRFSAKFTMAHGPVFDGPDQFNPAFLYLADLDGSATTDLVYVGRNDFRAWLNINGNKWSEQPKVIDAFPSIDHLSDIAVIDFLGTGTAAIVWSSPLASDAARPLRFIDLMDSKKPHLLYSYENNMGKEVNFEYASSTRFYLEDKERGAPWATRIPFPVHVVTRVTSKDHVRETVFTRTFSYHHGYYDGVEREFRGFGRVEQHDTEAYSSFKLNGASNVVEESLHQPPVKTVKWFHTGASLKKKFLTRAFETEYYTNPDMDAYALSGPTLPDGLTGEEWHEALRACKGLVIRTEVYADDDTEKKGHPYAVSQSGYDIRKVQSRGENKHACFQVISREGINYTYDRVPADPRISHTFVLEADDRGMVRKSASVTYPRVARPAGIPDAVWHEQSKRHIVYSETTYTDDIDTDDDYRLRTPYETLKYEVIGLPEDPGLFLTRQLLRDRCLAAAAIPFEDDGDGTLQKRLLSHSRLYFMKNDLSGGLPLGIRDSLGLSHQSFRMALTPGLVHRHYGARVSDAMLVTAGYQHSEGDENWWIPSGTALFPPDAADRFYFPNGFKDALGTEAHVSYDPYTYLPQSTIDAMGNTVTVQNDYRTLSPFMIIDINQNRSAVETDELGMVVKSAIMGKAGLNEGDTLFDPTMRLEYDLFNWMHNGKPNYVRTLAREQHGAGNLVWQEAYAYSDGGGRVVMTKTQADGGTARLWNDTLKTVEEVETEDRWIGNGRTIFNNKGNPVKKYEPYFSATHDYESEADLVETGVTPILYYDPVGRNYRTELPDGTFTQSEFSPWQIRSFDANDTVRNSQWYMDRGSPDPLLPEPGDKAQRAAWLAAKHHDTPVIIHADSLGGAIYTIADYGGGKTTSTRSESDLAGRFSKVFDQLDREVSSGYVNMTGNAIFGKSAEKGEKRLLTDVLGCLVRLWDNSAREFYLDYDTIHRPVNAFLHENGTDYCIGRIVYGENHPDGVARNLKGRAFQLFDSSGMTRINTIDFKGNPLSIDRQIAREFKSIVDWDALSGLTDIADIAQAAAPSLEVTGTGDPDIFSFSGSFDALNRPVQVQLPDGTVMAPQYDRGSILKSLSARIRGQGDFIPFLKDQKQNARGQIVSAKLGNDTLTRYFYDPNTFRLTNLVTLKNGNAPPSSALQDLNYIYDPVGNITWFSDQARQTHFFRNSVVKPESLYEYDALYQLVKATGREHAGITNNAQRFHEDLPFITPMPHNNDVNAVRKYTEVYQYDDLGNILEMAHHTADPQGNWTRRYQYAYETDPLDNTNRLLATSMPGDPVTGPYTASYTHDLFGNMVQMPHLQELDWNYLDQLSRADLGGGGNAYYTYDAGGMRSRKIIERNGGQLQERLYLGPVEIFRKKTNGTLHFERWTVNIMGLAQVDTKTLDTENSDPANPMDTPLIRYRYGNHQQSATLELDKDAKVISYEEFHPFGTTAYRLSDGGADISLKRYRFSGKERDSETGFDYFGFRYYASWLGRWTSSDPIGIQGGMNTFQYAANNPVCCIDPNGLTPRLTEFNAPPPDIAYTGTRQQFIDWVNSNPIVGTGTIVDDETGESVTVTLSIRLTATDATRVTGADGREFWQLQTGQYTGVPGSAVILPTPADADPDAQEAGQPGTGEGDGGTGPPDGGGTSGGDAGGSPDAGEGGRVGSDPRDVTSPGGASATATPGTVTRATWADEGVRGPAIDRMSGNNLGRNAPGADIVKNGVATQVRSSGSTDPGELANVARNATRDAQSFLDANPSTTQGMRPRAEVVFPENAPPSANSAIEGALEARPGEPVPGHPNLRTGARSEIPGEPPIASRGLPRRARIGGGFMAGVGFGLSAYSLYADVQAGDVPMGVGDAVGVVGAGSEIYGLAAGNAVALKGGLIGAGLALGITSGVNSYRSFERGDALGGVVNAIGIVGGGMLIAAALVASAPLAAALAIGGLAIGIGVTLFNLGRN